MKILGIDTSSSNLSIALSDDKTIILSESQFVERRHSSVLVPKIQAMLQKAGIAINRIDGFIVGLGPGSFTGLRIGVSTVKGFGLALGKPCVGIASIDAIAMNNTLACDMVIPIIDAKRGQVYACIYKREGNKFIRLTQFLLLPVDELLKKVKGRPVFLGDGLKLYRGSIERFNKSAIFLGEDCWYPKAEHLIMLGFDNIKRHKNTSMEKLKPLYLYPKDCQVK